MLLQIHEPGETPLPHENDEAIGIDLGTTNSLVAISRGEKPQIISDILPSVVDGIKSIKRKMHEPAALVQGRTPVEISAEILKILKAQAENALGKEITKTVITVPAYFDETSRQATKDAARLAGLEVLRLINEPTAAALAYGLDKGAEGIYAIYDLGGGTFDISILKMEKGVFQVLATGGDTKLGGDDFDDLIGKPNARKIKEELSTKNEFEGVTRKKFEKLISPLVEKTISICAATIKDSGLKKPEIKGVVMVGGSTRVPLVQKKAEEFFGTKPLTDINPDEVVALGAAIQAEALTKGSNNLLLDVIPLSLGLETMHGIVEKIIWRNSPIPCSYAQEFTTFQNNQTGMIIHVLQGERETVEECRSLAKFELAGIPALPAGVARVRVQFTVDADGLLIVGAEEMHTGTKQEISVKPSYGLAPEQIEKMIIDSMKNAGADMETRLLREVKMEAERILISLQPALANYGYLLSEAEIKELRQGAQSLEELMQGADRDKIDAAKNLLNEKTEILASRIMDKNINSALKGKTVDEVIK